MSNFTTTSKMPEKLEKHLIKSWKCDLMHSRIPERQEDGTYKWVCKECEKELNNDNE